LNRIHAAESLEPERSSFETWIAVEKLRRYKLPGTDEIPAEMIQQEAIRYILGFTNLLTVFEIRKNFQSSGKNLLLYLFIRSVIKLTSNYRELSVLSTAYKPVSNILLSRLTPYVDEIIGDHQCLFERNRSTTDQILEKNGSTVGL
jgi:hypothetical protein